MSSGPATASQGARAVGDTPSNCSYHLRTLAKYGWVEADDSADARERPWRALVTGFSLEPPGDPDSPLGRNTAALLAMTVQQDQREVLEAKHTTRHWSAHGRTHRHMTLTRSV